ncbi:MAG: hypothetical protein HS115_08060 [Spirochaetales bacterium]|nr:hypothetical protein [Spirochaetales bacterium]
MEILINDQKLDVTFGEEKNLDEVYRGVERWLGEHGRHILDFRIDGKPIRRETLAHYDLAHTGLLEIIAGDTQDMLLSSLVELDHYVDKIGSYLFDRTEISLSATDLEQLQEGLLSIEDVLESARRILGIDLSRSGHAEKSMKEVQKRLKELLHNQDADFRDEFLENLRDLKSFLMRLIGQLRAMRATPESLLEELDTFYQDLPTIQQAFANVNAQFNRGQDITALEELDLASERLDHVLAHLNALDYHLSGRGVPLAALSLKGKTFRQKIDDLSGLLEELSSAFLEGDLVAVGDILEYELGSELEELRPYLTEIRPLFVASLVAAQS